MRLNLGAVVRRRRWARGVVVATTACALTMSALLSVQTSASASELDEYVNLPLVNRNAEYGPGGVHPALPTDLGILQALVEEARASGRTPESYAALLFQYRLVVATEAAGIDLASWNPRIGVSANRSNLVKSYRFYEDLQLGHSELQWAGMGGQVGADFGGGLIDFELMADVYSLPNLQQLANAIVSQVTDRVGKQALEQLPEGLRALASVGRTVTADDLDFALGMILVMQKNIFSDLMPMHQAYADEGLPALEEMQRAGLFGHDVMDAWRDVASGDPDRIAQGNAALLQREQGVIIRDQWDRVRAYKGDVGEAITYASTVAGSPSVAGVVPPRSFRPLEFTTTLADGRTANVTMPLPDWNWSVYEDRWDYTTSQLLPKYRAMVEEDWPRLVATLSVPYEIQLESHRPMMTLPQTLESALSSLKVTVQ